MVLQFCSLWHKSSAVFAEVTVYAEEKTQWKASNWECLLRIFLFLIWFRLNPLCPVLLLSHCSVEKHVCTSTWNMITELISTGVIGLNNYICWRTLISLLFSWLRAFDIKRSSDTVECLIHCSWNAFYLWPSFAWLHLGRHWPDNTRSYHYYYPGPK